MASPIILFRSDNSSEQNREKEIASKFFPVVSLRSEIPPDSWVIPRYSCLPFYRELEQDLKKNQSQLINSYRQHQFIANFLDYYQQIQHLTPRSWTEKEFPYCDYQGPLVIKGKTNSKKHWWSTKMFAANRREAVEVAQRLVEDSLIGTQELIYRKYVPLVTLEVDSISGLPYSNEWRCFFYRDQLIDYGFYWSSASPEAQAKAKFTEEALGVIREAAKILSPLVNFFVVDVAEKKDGGWIVIEINDGSMSGLSEIEPENFYRRLSQVIWKYCLVCHAFPSLGNAQNLDGCTLCKNCLDGLGQQVVKELKKLEDQ